MSINRENLTKLAEYLEQLPVDYSHFDMAQFETFDDRSDLINYTLAGRDDTAWTCGAAACAVGHGPSAGILFTENEIVNGFPLWDDYAERFVTDPYLFDWLFSWVWVGIDNTHRGAAARIRFLLDGNELPNIFSDDDKGMTDLYSKYLVK